jgi:recombinational DNA repair protein (RecF pathway)
LQKTEGIILRRQEIRETSLILIAFTRDLGKIHGLVKGVRGSRAAVPWYLEPLTLQSLVVYERKRSTMALISSFDLIDAYDPIRKDFTRTAYAGLLLDLTDVMTETGDPHPEIFTLLRHALTALAEDGDPRSVARFYEANLLRMTGSLPEVGRLSLSAGARASLTQIFQTPADRLTRLRLSREVEEELRSMLQAQFHHVLDRELRSRAFLAAVGLEGIPEAVHSVDYTIGDEKKRTPKI